MHEGSILSVELTRDNKNSNLQLWKTRRERLKSALYLRLRKRKTLFLKKTNIHSVANYQISKKLKGGPFGGNKYFKRVSQCRKTFEVFQHPSSRKTWNNWRKFFLYFREKISQCRKKLKGGTLWDFSTSILSQNIKKCRGSLWGKNFRKKVSIFPEKKSHYNSRVSLHEAATKNWTSLVFRNFTSKTVSFLGWTGWFLQDKQISKRLL